MSIKEILGAFCDTASAPNLVRSITADATIVNAQKPAPGGPS